MNSIELVTLIVAGVALVVIIALGLWVGALYRRTRRLENHYHRLMAGGEAMNLEEALDRLLLRLDDVSDRMVVLEAADRARDGAVRSSIQHVGMVRFNPFSDTGGDLSFTLALANADGDGVVLYNLHGRGEARLYAKPLTRWGSSYPLSDEETEAVNRARQGGAAEAEA